MGSSPISCSWNLVDYIAARFFYAFRAVPAFVAQGDAMGEYIASFAQQMLFVVVGAVPTIMSIFREQKTVNRVAQIGYMQNTEGFMN